MTILNTMIDTVKNLLISSPLLSNVTFINASPCELVPSPLNKIYASIGLAGIKVLQGAFSGYLGIEDGEEIYGKLADLKIKIKIYLPQSSGGSECYNVFSNIYETFLNNEIDLNVQSVTCDEVKFNSDAYAFSLECFLNVSSFIADRFEVINS